MTRPSLVDVANFTGVDARHLIDEVIRQVPEIAALGWDKIQGQQYPTVVRTADPTAAFRNANDGSNAVKSIFEPRLVSCHILNPRWECDRAVADVFPMGGAAKFIALEAAAILRAGFKAVAKNIYYGNASPGDTTGFPGFIQAYDSTNMLVDAGGTTANTGSSVWMIRRGEQDVMGILGGNGNLDVSDVRIETITGSNSQPLTGYIQELLCWVGMQVASKWSIGRISKLTADSGKTLTDSLLSQLLEKFPADQQPDLILMSRRSLGQLQRSRTTYSPTGMPAPRPTEYEGIPIQVTDSILNTESLTL